ncbi:MAG: Trk system potassium transporter TrkA [Lachnospiraceae bacterium]|nr:Trk system potassium transporter TrkA [Lachnospiraceae bacterium]
MKIIIVGGGKVGETLVANLSREGHDITVIDRHDKIVDQICDRYDVMGFTGNGASYTVLEEADIAHADLVIASTGHDELNLFVCLLARKAGNCQTIARVHNPEYNRAVNYIKEDLGLALVINQEFAAAQEAARVLRFPSAIEINTFAKGKVELLHFRIPQGSVLDGMDLYSMHGELKCNVLVCTLERDGSMVIPQGNTVLRAGDVISIVAPIEEQERFFNTIGLETHAVRNVMIIGGGDVALYLGRMLIHSGIQVKIIERDLKRCEELAEIIPKATIIHGDGTDKELLEEEGISNTESVVCLTGIDEENVVLSLFAKHCGVRKIITKVNRVAFEEVFESLNLDTMISPKNITAELIVQYVRAMQNSFGSNIETLHRMMDDQAEALEFKIRDNFTKTEIPLSQLSLKPGVLVGAIYRNGRFILPRGADVIKRGDTVLIITTIKGLNDITDVLA